jgi:hypothetical protein
MTRRSQSAASPNGRIAALIDEHFDGNVTKAAEAIGCSYDPLWRAYRNHLERGPNADLIVAVARHFNVTTDWLLTGQVANGLQPGDSS